MTLRASCSLKGKKKKLYHLKTSSTRVAAKPSCTKGVKITVTITASKAGANPTTWRKTWKVKGKKPIRCEAG